MMAPTALHWFRRDLRLGDNPAWAEATRHDQAAGLVVIEPQLVAAAGPFRKRAYLQAVVGLDHSLRSRGGRLWVAEGDPARVVPQVADALGAQVVTFNSDVTRWSERRDQQVTSTLSQPTRRYWGTLVHPPGSVLTAKGRLSRVFTAFYRRWVTMALAEGVTPGRAELISPPPGATLSDLRHDLPDEPWGEDQARGRLRSWWDRVDEYHMTRDHIGADDTSNVSAELRFGLLSPRQVAAEVGDHTPGRAAYVRQLAWRDWYAHLTAEHPDIDRVALRPEYGRIAWADGPEADTVFEDWKAGLTGYPIVDAAMRELASTGRLHNRLRMVAASFLVKDLLIDWRRGERWFRYLLIDGDIPQNAGNWQWVAGTGPDAAPYFRIFNPVTQSRRLDPEGLHLRRWLPELGGLDAHSIHAPWTVGRLELASAGVTLGETYPSPLVDHAKARRRTLDAYRQALQPSRHPHPAAT